MILVNNVDMEKDMHVWEWGIYGKYLYLPINFVVKKSSL